MHSRLTKGTVLLIGFDTMLGMPFQQGNNFSISLNCESAQEADKLFSALGESGKVIMPMQDMFWGLIGAWSRIDLVLTGCSTSNGQGKDSHLAPEPRLLQSRFLPTSKSSAERVRYESMSTASVSGQEPNPSTIFEALNAYQRSAALKAAIELEVFTHIARGDSTADGLARTLSASTEVSVYCAITS